MFRKQQQKNPQIKADIIIYYVCDCWPSFRCDFLQNWYYHSFIIWIFILRVFKFQRDFHFNFLSSLRKKNCIHHSWECQQNVETVFESLHLAQPESMLLILIDITCPINLNFLGPTKTAISTGVYINKLLVR